MNNAILKVRITYWLLDPLTLIQIIFCINILVINVTVFIVSLHFLLHQTPLGDDIHYTYG